MKKYIAAAALLAVSGVSHASLIDFESGLDPIFNYTEVTTGSGSQSATSGYDAMQVFTGSNGFAFNPFAASPSDFVLADVNGVFDLGSFAIAGAWGTQTLMVEGLNDGQLLYTDYLDVSTSPFEAIFNWVGIDQLTISVDPNGYVDTTPNAGSGQHWVLDNMIINEYVGQDVPAPSAILLMVLAGLGLTAARRR
ncbi:PEP-CTERM sorting domain-containing protein [Corallincola platygyrae]|uniref:PEP-CTERM sorting domain-containing protein n=1 Tax=Corallincola platygyrae TaxID=1193278 RepID=A0ABW4XQA0_9GAMM